MENQLFLFFFTFMNSRLLLLLLPLPASGFFLRGNSLWPAVVEDVCEATRGAPMLCPVGLYLPSNQCFPAVHNSSLTEAEEEKNCVTVLTCNIHLSCASQAPWALAVLVNVLCPSLPCAKMPPSSSSSADVLLPASHTSCVWPSCILHPFGAFLPFSRTNRTSLDFPLSHCLSAWGMMCGGHEPSARSALGQQRGTAEFFQLIYVCAYTHPAFICRLTNGISAKLRASSIYSFRICVCELPSLLGFSLLTEDGILVNFFFFNSSLFQASLFKNFQQI